MIYFTFNELDCLFSNVFDECSLQAFLHLDESILYLQQSPSVITFQFVILSGHDLVGSNELDLDAGREDKECNEETNLEDGRQAEHWSSGLGHPVKESRDHQKVVHKTQLEMVKQNGTNNAQLDQYGDGGHEHHADACSICAEQEERRKIRHGTGKNKCKSKAKAAK